MITNGEVTINRRRRAGDYEHNDATVKLSFTMEGVANEEEFRCRVTDEAVALANRGLQMQSMANAASDAATSQLVPVPETTAGSSRRRSKPEPVLTPAEPALQVVTTELASAPSTLEAPLVPPTPLAAAPIVAPPALGNGALNVATASPSIPTNGSLGATPIVIGAFPSPTRANLASAQAQYPNPTVPVPADVASPTAASTSSDAAGGGRYSDKAEFQKELVAQVTRINGLRPGRGGLEVNQVIAKFVAPPNGAGAIPVEQREAFMAEVAAIQ